MYETEANNSSESAQAIPSDVRGKLKDLRNSVLARTTLPWSEHCTECVWPTCYSTCDLYHPREDGRCRRFVDGMVRVNCPEAVNSYLLKISFKQWGKLWSPGNVHLCPIKVSDARERRDYRIGTFLYNLPMPPSSSTRIKGWRYKFKKAIASRPVNNEPAPTSFLLECFNPNFGEATLSLTMRATSEQVRISYQKLLVLTPGFHRIRIPMEEISAVLKLSEPFSIELIPNNVDGILTLYFGLIDFVREKGEVDRNLNPVKCVVWDLDETIWEGILTEHGPSQLSLKPGIAQVLQALDERGILLSIASKNNCDDALNALKRFNISDYFLVPQISWGPKSDAIHEIARRLNIGEDSFLFVDDSEFELQQVKAACPGVRVANARDYQIIPDMKECQVSVTAESRARRSMYQVDAARQSLAGDFGNDYIAFLRHCRIELAICPMSEANLERVHELTQRTNQMNFSGNRYDRGVLKNLLQTPYLSTYVISCKDQFGLYGIVGFSIVDDREPRMTDLMFSCRVQSKGSSTRFFHISSANTLAPRAGISSRTIVKLLVMPRRAVCSQISSLRK